jgi:pyruvate formate lyase activating enzyme
MDIKNSPRKYRQTACRKINFYDIKKSAKIIMNSGIPYEFRTTVVPTLHTAKDFEAIGKWLCGAKKYYLQNFRPTKTLDPTFSTIKPYTQKKLSIFRDILKKYISNVFIR